MTPEQPTLEQEKNTEKGKRRGRIKRATARIAPQIAHALGGPLAGAAVGALSRALFGSEHASETDVADALERASPAQVIAIKQAELDFQQAVQALAVEEARIHAGDRDSARQRQQAMDDWTPSVLGALIITGFFVVLAAMLTRQIPQGAETEFSILLGALATMTAAVVNYFFGSSAGSKEKTRMMYPPLPNGEVKER